MNYYICIFDFSIKNERSSFDEKDIRNLWFARIDILSLKDK